MISRVPDCFIGCFEIQDFELLGKVVCSQPITHTPTYFVDRAVVKGFDGIKSFGEIEERLSGSLRHLRSRAGLRQSDFAELIGLSTLVYGRYERAFSKLTITRMLYACEILDFKPHEMLFEVAPQLWGDSEQEARDRLELSDLSLHLPYCTAHEILAIARKLKALHDKDVNDRKNVTFDEEWSSTSQ